MRVTATPFQALVDNTRCLQESNERIVGPVDIRNDNCPADLWPVPFCGLLCECRRCD